MIQIPTGDLAALVRTEDQHLLTLSDEQYNALWSAEWTAADPTLGPLMEILTRTLAASGLAETSADGDITLTGSAAFIRAAHTQARSATVVRASDSETMSCWVQLAEGVTLEQSREAPGISHFALKETGRAVRQLVHHLVPTGPARTDDAEAGNLQQIIECNATWSYMEVIGAPVAEWIVADSSLERAAMLLANDGSTPGWMALAKQDGAVEISPTDRSAAVQLLMDLIAAADGLIPELSR